MQAEIVTRIKDHGTALDPQNDIKPYFPMGGKGKGPEEKVVFHENETKALKNLGLKPGKGVSSSLLKSHTQH